MTIQAQLPDGTILEFPEGTSQDVIQNAVRQQLGLLQPEPQQPQFTDVPSVQNGQVQFLGDTGEVTQNTAIEQPSAKAREVVKGGLAEEIFEPVATVAGGLAGSALGGLEASARAGLGQGLDKAVDELRKTQEFFASQPETEAGKRGLEVVNRSLQSLEDVINFAAGGTAGLLDIALNPISNIREGFEPAMQEVRAIREQGLGKAAGQEAFEKTGSPALATLTEVSPMVGELVGGRFIGAGQPKRPVIDEPVSRVEKLDESGIDAPAEVQTEIKSAADTLKSGTPEEIAQLIEADKEFFKAADELGISTEPLASFASKNPQFRDVEGALRKIPGSPLEPQAIAFIEDLSKRADDIIVQYGGTLDKALLSDNFKADSLKTIKDLEAQADDVYNIISESLLDANRFPATNTVNFLEDLKNKGRLSGKLAGALKKLKPKEKTIEGKPATLTSPQVPSRVESINPKLGTIDQLRRDIGQAINKGSGPFKDSSSGLLKALYAKLTKDQDLIAESANLSEVTTAAKGLISQRKQLEDNLQALLGNDLNKSLSVTVGQSVKNLSKGEVDKFRNVMEAIPPEMRQGAVLSAMNDVFKGTGVGQQSLSTNQFVKWFETINRSPIVKKELFKNLPDGAPKAIENLYKVSKGVDNAQRQVTPTGRVNALFQDQQSLIRKLVGRTLPTITSVATGSPIASVATNTVTDFLTQGTDRALATSAMMASPQFQNIVRDSAKQNVSKSKAPDEALKNKERKFMESEEFKFWLGTLPQNSRDLAATGIIGYLYQQEDEQ